MEYVILNNGVRMPKVGFGVYQIPKQDTERCVLDAIKAGYRLFDTAQSYFNEEELGRAIARSGIARKEFFIVTKVWLDNYGYAKCKKSVMDSMRRLKMGYIDLVLLHQPYGDYYEAYRALEDLYQQGYIKAIGVSNFAPDRLADICLFDRTVVPQVNQIEANVLNSQEEAHKNMQEFGVQMQAWAPFGEGKNNMFNNSVLVNIASAHNKTVAQVILRFMIQRDIPVLCKTTHFERMQENINIFDFELTEDEMNKIYALDEGKSLFFNHDDPKTVKWFDKTVKSVRENMPGEKGEEEL